MLLQSMTLSTKIVFSKWPYTALAGAIAGIFWIIFNSFDQLLFFFPVLTFYLSSDAIPSFIISNITAVLLGIVISMNVYVFKNLKGLKMIGGGTSSLFSGSSLSIISSTCASCSSIGFLLISTFGGVGVSVSAFLSNYQIPLRLISLMLLIWAYYSVTKMLTRSSSSCIIK